ncbi:MAG: hypothetical protein ACPKPY_00325 [Nitrososphaeraceae archaeon]
MIYTLLIGNNFIENSPKQILLNGQKIFSIHEEEHGPSITSIIYGQNNNKIIEVERNVIKYYSDDLSFKINEKSHILIQDKTGKNILQSRIIDKQMLLVSGIFFIGSDSLSITQNYLITPSGKRIMHDKIDSKNGIINITNNEIKYLG